jgi:hypothetical protein
MRHIRLYLFTFAALFSSPLLAGIGTVNIATSETEVLPANSSRRWLILQNDSTSEIFIKIEVSETALTPTNGIRLAPNGGILTITSTGSANPSRNRITAISSTGINSLRYQEGNEN